MKRKTKIFAATLVCLVVCVVLVFVGMKVYADSKSKTIPEGVFVDSVALGGKTADEAQELVKEYIKNLGNRKFTLVVGGQSVKTTLDKLGFRCVENNYIEEASNFGKTGNLIKRYKELKDIEHQTRVFKLEFTIDDAKATKFIEDKCKKFEIEPVNAVLTRKNSSFHIKKEVSGRTINVKDTIEKIKSVFTDDWNYEAVRVEAVVADAVPDITKEQLEKVKDVLGQYSTTFASSSANRAANLDNAARLINGTLLMPGEEFSTSGALTPFTQENGYKQAGAYLNGKVVDSVGGGVCQAATTLYNALLLAELEITERFNHSMIVSYVQPSMDAAISDGYKDLKFKNNTEAPIYVEGYTSGRTIYFKIYGEETRDTVNRTIKYVSETTQTIQPGPDKITKDPTKPASYRVVEQSAHVGYKACLWKYVYVDGKEQSKEQVNSSSYAAEPAYVTVGTIQVKKDKEKDAESEDDKDKEENEKKESDSKEDSNNKENPNSEEDPDRKDSEKKKPDKKDSASIRNNTVKPSKKPEASSSNHEAGKKPASKPDKKPVSKADKKEHSSTHTDNTADQTGEE